MRFALQRSAYYGGPWVQLFAAPTPSHPGALGLTGRRGERVRWWCEGVAVELWEWAERVPVNPSDLQCTDFVAGWRLVQRQANPVPSADELGHFFAQG